MLERLAKTLHKFRIYTNQKGTYKYTYGRFIATYLLPGVTGAKGAVGMRQATAKKVDPRALQGLRLVRAQAGLRSRDVDRWAD